VTESMTRAFTLLQLASRDGMAGVDAGDAKYEVITLTKAIVIEAGCLDNRHILPLVPLTDGL